MTDTPTPRVPHAKLMTLVAEAEMEEWPSTSAWYWPRMLALDLRDSRALAQSQAATIAERNAEIEQLKGRKPFKLEVSKEWCLRMAESEGDAVIGAGVPGPEHKASSMLAEALAEIDRLHSIYIQACNGRAEIREALMAERSANAALTERLARAEAALKSALPQAEGCFANHYGDNPEGATEPEHIRLMRAALTPTKES